MLSSEHYPASTDWCSAARCGCWRTNRDLRLRLFDDDGASKQEQRCHAAAVTRKLALLHAHRLIRKVPGTHRYHLSRQGRIIVTALITARNANANALTKLAA